jgi:gluconokinase
MTHSIVVVLMGVSGAGKSTAMARMAERFGWPSLEGDKLHAHANIAKMRAGVPLTDDDRWPWLRAIAAWIRDREVSGENGVVTCSALARRYRDRLRGGHPSVRFVHLVADAAVLEPRLQRRRDHYMPASLLANQLTMLEPLEPDEPGITLSAALTPDAIVDAIAARFALTASRF